ncbi:unnamed protein product [Sphagnum jensenii]|uniref:Uncharacterized protein n=1 Tax=Sphagnum jensenii TaxID=128206 RepID=A0ABP1A9Q6_9BRYO
MRVLNVVVKKVFVRVSFLHYVIQKCFVLFANHVKKTLSVLTVSHPPTLIQPANSSIFTQNHAVPRPALYNSHFKIRTYFYSKTTILTNEDILFIR